MEQLRLNHYVIESNGHAKWVHETLEMAPEVNSCPKGHPPIISHTPGDTPAPYRIGCAECESVWTCLRVDDVFGDTLEEAIENWNEDNPEFDEDEEDEW